MPRVGGGGQGRAGAAVGRWFDGKAVKSMHSSLSQS